MTKPSDKSLSTRLLSRTVASCECGTKTPDHMWHEPTCLYRLLMEALEQIEPDMFVTTLPRDPMPKIDWD
jgi:hypothetical protein